MHINILYVDKPEHGLHEALAERSTTYYTNCTSNYVYYIHAILSVNSRNTSQGYYHLKK